MGKLKKRANGSPRKNLLKVSDPDGDLMEKMNVSKIGFNNRVRGLGRACCRAINSAGRAFSGLNKKMSKIGMGLLGNRFLSFDDGTTLKDLGDDLIETQKSQNSVNSTVTCPSVLVVGNKSNMTGMDSDYLMDDILSVSENDVTEDENVLHTVDESDVLHYVEKIDNDIVMEKSLSDDSEEFCIVYEIKSPVLCKVPCNADVD